MPWPVKTLSWCLVLLSASSRQGLGQRPDTIDSAKVIVPSQDSLMAILDAYWEKRVTAAAAAKVIADYLVGTGKPLNIQMDPELQDAVDREMKARGRY